MEALATSSTCPECRGDGYRVEAEVQPGPGDGEGRRARAVARVCSCREPCPHCQGRGFVYTSRQVEFSRKVGVRSYEALAQCVCRLLAQRVATFAQTGIPAHHATSSFSTFRAKGDDQEKTAADVREEEGDSRYWADAPRSRTRCRSAAESRCVFPEPTRPAMTNLPIWGETRLGWRPPNWLR